MTSVIPLGTVERVPLKQAWPTEDENFTPWLAQAEAISVLGEALNLELEVEAIEHWVGSFRADILARAIDEADHRVIIENQFGRTNHNHLGQILTYLAGIEAWMLAKMDRFKKVFAARIKSVSLSKLTTANGDEAEDD